MLLSSLFLCFSLSVASCRRFNLEEVEKILKVAVNAVDGPMDAEQQAIVDPLKADITLFDNVTPQVQCEAPSATVSRTTCVAPDEQQNVVERRVSGTFNFVNTVGGPIDEVHVMNLAAKPEDRICTQLVKKNDRVSAECGVQVEVFKHDDGPLDCETDDCIVWLLINDVGGLKKRASQGGLNGFGTSCSCCSSQLDFCDNFGDWDISQFVSSQVAIDVCNVGWGDDSWEFNQPIVAKPVRGDATAAAAASAVFPNNCNFAHLSVKGDPSAEIFQSGSLQRKISPPLDGGFEAKVKLFADQAGAGISIFLEKTIGSGEIKKTFLAASGGDSPFQVGQASEISISVSGSYFYSAENANKDINWIRIEAAGSIGQSVYIAAVSIELEEIDPNDDPLGFALRPGNEQDHLISPFDNEPVIDALDQCFTGQVQKRDYCSYMSDSSHQRFDSLQFIIQGVSFTHAYFPSQTNVANLVTETECLNGQFGLFSNDGVLNQAFCGLTDMKGYSFVPSPLSPNLIDCTSKPCVFTVVFQLPLPNSFPDTKRKVILKCENAQLC